MGPLWIAAGGGDFASAPQANMGPTDINFTQVAKLTLSSRPKTCFLVFRAYRRHVTIVYSTREQLRFRFLKDAALVRHVYA